mgnify:CR=1 FL=1
MHILTKLLVVLTAVLGVLLSGLTIAYTSNADAIRAELDGARARAANAEATAQRSAATEASARDALERQVESLQASLTETRTSMNALRTDNNRLLAENKRLNIAEQAYQTSIDDYAARIDSMVEVLRGFQVEIGTLRQRELALQRRELELTDRLADLESEIEAKDGTLRALREQVVELEQTLAGGPAAGRAEAVATAPSSFRARVLRVQRDANNDLLVSIDAGTNDRLANRMRLNVVREGRFLGTVTLERVDLNESVGRLTLRVPDAPAITSGDLVLPASL